MTIKNPEIMKYICEQLATGRSLRSICREDGMPNECTVRGWALDDAVFYSQYARSRDIGMSAMEDELLEIVDTPVDKLVTGGTDSGEVANRRLRADTRKWIMSKIAPKKYGDNARLELTGADSGPVQIEHKGSAIAELIAKAAARKAKQDDDLDELA